MAEISLGLPINGETEKIYNALATQKGLSSWWTTDVKAEEKINSVIEFGFYGHKAVHFMKITSLKPLSEVEWFCENSPIEEWNNTRISFNITDFDPEHPYSPNLRFTQTKVKPTDNFGPINYNWAKYLTSLKSFVETGKGAPNTT